MEDYSRQCPQCDTTIVYSNKYILKTAITKNTICKKCALLNHNKKMGEEQRLGLRENGFKGKTHTADTKIKLSDQMKGRKLSDEHIQNIKSGLAKWDRPKIDGGFYGAWVKKYGKDIADAKLIEYKNKISQRVSGKNNPMYGKPSPKGSGNGWKGYYKGVYFRSLLELSFLVNYVDRFNMKLESGEKAKWAIEYVTPIGKMGTYFPDYIINDKYMVEIKPKKLINTPLIKSKSESAIEFCKKYDLKYKIFEPIKLSKQMILDLYNNKHLIFSEKLESK